MKPLTEADLRRLAGLPEKQVKENTIDNYEIADILSDLKEYEDDEYMELEFMMDHNLDITSHPKLQTFWMKKRGAVAEYLGRLLKDFVDDFDTVPQLDDVATWTNYVYNGFDVVFRNNPNTPQIKQYLEANKEPFIKNLLINIKKANGQSESISLILRILNTIGINWPELKIISRTP